MPRPSEITPLPRTSQPDRLGSSILFRLDGRLLGFEGPLCHMLSS
jgi:hypothetical protein